MAADIEQAMRATLLGNATLVALLASTTSIYSGAAPMDSAFPFIVMSVPAREDVRHQSGSTDVRNATFQIECYAREYDDARDIGYAVDAVLRDQINTTFGSGGFATAVLACLREADGDETIPPDEGRPLPVHIRSLSYLVWYRNS